MWIYPWTYPSPLEAGSGPWAGPGWVLPPCDSNTKVPQPGTIDQSAQRPDQYGVYTIPTSGSDSDSQEETSDRVTQIQTHTLTVTDDLARVDINLDSEESFQEFLECNPDQTVLRQQVTVSLNTI